MKNFLIVLCFAFFVFTTLQAQSKVLVLQNEVTKLQINQLGGAIIDFHHLINPINPFSWKLSTAQMPKNNQTGAAFAGHFLCLGRWGSPTQGEINAGVPHNGQASRDKWTIHTAKDKLSAKMLIKAPLDGIAVQRNVILDSKQPVFKVTETVKNNSTVGRLFNMVQHATIGPPFLNENTRIDSNADEGFMQSMSYPDPYRMAYTWPLAYTDSTSSTVDLRLSNSNISYVSTHIMRDSIGWITAYNPESRQVLGYVWKTSDYGWLNLWHQLVDDKLWAKGLEFGTTGIGRSYQDLLASDTRFFGKPSFFFLDAGETIQKSYYCFLIAVDDTHIKNVRLTNQNLEIETSTKKYSLNLKSIF
jgi:hypothetical protein